MVKQRIFAVSVAAVLAQLSAVGFAYAADTATFDPYAASDAQGNFLKPPLGYPQSSRSTPSEGSSDRTSVNSQATSVSARQSPETTASTYTYANAPTPFTPITDRILADPTFLTLKGQILGNTTYSYSNFETNRRNDLNQKDLSEVTRGNHFLQNLAYGLTDDLSLRASIGYTTSNYKNDYADGTSLRVDSSGFTNPTFGATYRVVDQNKAPFIWDISGYYTPDAFPYKEGTSTNAGSVADGRQSGEVSTSISRVMKNLTLQAETGIDFLGDQKAVHLSDGSATDVRASADYYIGLRTQTRLTSAASVGLGGIYTFRDNMKARNAADGYDYVIKQGNVADLYTSFNYHIIPNRLVASFEYDHYMYGTDKYEYSQPSAVDNVSWKDSGENLGLFRLHYLFF